MLVFVEGGKPENQEENSWSKARTNNKLNPHMALGQNQTRATLVASDRSHHYAIPAPTQCLDETKQKRDALYYKTLLPKSTEDSK